MNDLETIENYFAGQLPDVEKTRFEQQIVADPDLAEAVSFYVQAKQMARSEALDQRKTEWAALQQQEAQASRRVWMPIAYAAAACVLLVLGFFLFWPQPSTKQLANQYIQDHLTTLSVTMGSQPDSLQLASQAYNEGQFDAAEAIVLAKLTRDSTNSDFLKIAGLVSLRQENYDQAIVQFHRLGQRTELRANPGLFYEALAYLKRSQPTDKVTARQLLQTVIDQNLEGRKGAKELIEKL
ncbi:hypothetical protein GCM10028808_31150 [Spirosoma migulaei]